MTNRLTRRLCTGAVLAALYAVLTLMLPMLSYGPIQIRLAEALTVLPFLLPEAIPGLAVGCFVANLLASPYALDWLVGTAATLLAAFWTGRLRHRRLCPLPPVICNMTLVGAEIAWFEAGTSAAFFPLWAYNALTVGIGELLVCCILGTLVLRLWPRVSYLRRITPEDRLELLRRGREGAFSEMYGGRKNRR